MPRSVLRRAATRVAAASTVAVALIVTCLAPTAWAATAPGVPKDVMPVPGDQSVTLSWSPPVSDGGSPITGYHVVITGDPAPIVIDVAAPTTTTGIVPLTVRGSHGYRVEAVNAVGAGQARTGSLNIYARPTPPQHVLPIAHDQRVSVHFSPPADSGGPSIQGCKATASPGGKFGSGPGTVSPIQVTGLTNGVDYTFSVTCTTDNQVAWLTGPDDDIIAVYGYNLTSDPAVSSVATPSAPPTPTFNVTSAVDAVDANVGNGVCLTAGGVCTLRAAVQEANAAASPASIILGGSTYNLSIAGAGEDAAATGDLDVTGDVTIIGPGSINAAGIDRVFDVRPGGSADLRYLTVRGGSAITDSSVALGAGGGILNQGDLFLYAVTVTTNSGLFGGGIASGTGNLTVVASRLTSNTSYFGAGALIAGGTGTMRYTTIDVNTSLSSGGGIWNTGTVSVSESTILSNSAAKYAGGVGGFGSITVANTAVTSNQALAGGGVGIAGTGSVVRSTVSGNTATAGGVGGGVLNAGTTTVDTSTITGNTAPAGGGIFNAGTSYAAAGSLTLLSSTVTANTGSGVVNDAGATATMTSSISAGQNSGDDCGGTVGSGGYNLTSDLVCGFAGTGDVMGTPALLGALAGNGGPTMTQAPQAGSPAIGTGPPGCAEPDQRGAPRPGGGGCDKGAFET